MGNNMNGSNSFENTLAMGILLVVVVLFGPIMIVDGDFIFFSAVVCTIPLMIASIGVLGWFGLRSVMKVYREVTELKLQVMERTVAAQINLQRSAYFVLNEGQYTFDTKAGERASDQIVDLQALYYDSRRTFPNVPNSIRYDNRVESSKPQNMEVVPVSTRPQIIPTFTDLWKNGDLPKDGFILGIDDEGKNIVKPWSSLFSTIVNGGSGTGKSTLVRLILAQALLQRAKFLIIDPHFGAGEESLGESLFPLRPFMIGDVAHSDPEMIKILEYLTLLGKNRLQGIDQSKEPIFLIVDETTSLLQRSDVAKALTLALGQIAQETRKVGIYAICLGQNFNSSVMSTDVRNSFASVLSTASHRDTLGRLISKRAGQDLEMLRKPRALYYKVGDEHEIFSVPNCTADDINNLAQVLLKDGSIGVSNGSVGVSDGSVGGSDGSVIELVPNQSSSSTKTELIKMALQNGLSSNQIYMRYLKGQARSKALDLINEVKEGMQYEK
jgi:hypothetical protein